MQDTTMQLENEARPIDSSERRREHEHEPFNLTRSRPNHDTETLLRFLLGKTRRNTTSPDASPDASPDTSSHQDFTVIPQN